VKVIARPVSPEFFETRAQLVGLVTRQDFFVTRPLGTLAASPGDKCLEGGYLRDLNNKSQVYAVPCVHVASTGTSVGTGLAFLCGTAIELLFLDVL